MVQFPCFTTKIFLVQSIMTLHTEKSYRTLVLDCFAKILYVLKSGLSGPSADWRGGPLKTVTHIFLLEVSRLMSWNANRSQSSTTVSTILQGRKCFWIFLVHGQLIGTQYRRPSLFAVLLFAVSTTRGPENRGKPRITREKIVF